MSSYTAIAILKTEPSLLRKIKEGLLEKKECKYYPSQKEIESISILFKIRIDDKVKIAKQLKEISGDETGVDEKGIYGLSSELYKKNVIKVLVSKLEKPLARLNQEGDKFESWKAFDIMPVSDLLNNLDKMDSSLDAIYTPDCEWIETPEFTPYAPYNKKASIDWENRVKEILQKYTENGLVLLIDCNT